MLKEITYNGYSTLPSDYDSTDGDLATTINLIHEDRGVIGISQPEPIYLIPEGYKALATHKLASKLTNIIALRQQPVALMAAPLDSETDIASPEQWAVVSYDIPDFDGDPLITPVGNTLAVIFSGHPIRYFLFKEGKYLDLGTQPPFTSIEFALDFTDTVGPGISDYKVKLPVRFSNPRTPTHFDSPEENQRTRELQDEFDNILFSYLNTHVSDKVTSLGRFHQPFFIRYAYRLFDGTHSWHSIPVLMLPTTIVPPIIIGGYDPHDGNTYQTVTLYGSKIKIFSLYKRIIDSDIERLNHWKDIITHIDIFITPPIYTYLLQSDYSGESVDKDSDNRTKSAKNTSKLTRLSSLYEEALDRAAPIEESAGFSTVYNPAGTTTTGNRNNRQPSRSDDSMSYYFEGHYIMGRVSTNVIDNLSIDRIISFNTSDDSSDPYVIAPPYNPKFIETIKNTADGDFRLFASIKIEDVAVSDKVSYVVQDSKNLSNLQTRQPLTDDYRSHAVLKASTAHVYNSRLNIADIDICPAPMLPLRSAMAMSTPVLSGNNTPVLKSINAVTVYLRKNGVTIKSVIDSSMLSAYALYGATENALAEYPRYLFYPDPDAFLISISLSSDKTINIPLTKHDFLDGAYFFGGIAEKIDISVNALPENTDDMDTFYSASDTIRLSEINNPFIFPPSAAVSVGTAAGNTSVLALSSAAKALSQGQFGQFPLYAFTSEGVWALEVSSTGVYSARQPITRDVCINPRAITPIDSAVLFPTLRGIMLLSGSQTKCLSEPLNDTPFDISSLKGINELHLMIGHSEDSCLSIWKFSDFLKSCQMIYDYIHQRVILYNPCVTYAYVYSLKSGKWGMIYSSVSGNLNSYPQALAIDHSGNIIDFSEPDSELKPGLLISRPIKLGEADILKTIDTVIQRGYFRQGHVKSVLYGSRDLFHWHLVASSATHKINNISGTPYKYFRIALVCNLDDDESITGCTIQYTPRFLNRIR